MNDYSREQFRATMMGKLSEKAKPVYKRRGPNQHEVIEEVTANLDKGFRAKMARTMEESGVYTKVTNPTGMGVLDPEIPISIESRFAASVGFQTLRDFMVLYPRIQGDVEDVTKVGAMLEGLMPVIGDTSPITKAFTMLNQDTINELILDLFEGGFYGVHESNDVMAVDHKNVPIFRAGISFTNKGNLGTQCIECTVRYARDNTVVAKFLEIIKRHVSTSGSMDAGNFDTIVGFAGGQLDIRSESLEGATEALTEFYPWMNGEDITEYFLQFLHSSANVLILYGEPGGGKTTFLRTAVKRLGLRALGTADQRIMNTEGFIQQCGTKMSGRNDGAQYDVLIAEDAEILASRRSDGNTVMSSLLNALDGATKETSFKLVITTNQKDLSKMDPALLRPGRCFDVMEFGKLTAEQAMEVRALLGKPHMVFEKDDWLLADVLNRDTTKSRITVDGEAIVSPRFPLPKKK